MCATRVIPRPNRDDVLFRSMTSLHDSWMADADQILEPLMQRDATFWQRWAAVNFLREQFPERLGLERELLSELHAFLTPELNERLRMQVERLEHLHRDLELVCQRRAPAGETASAVRELLEALRLWYAEIEFAASGVRREDLGSRASRLLDRLVRSVSVGRIPTFDGLTLSVPDLCTSS